VGPRAGLDGPKISSPLGFDPGSSSANFSIGTIQDRNVNTYFQSKPLIDRTPV